jgi:hypothetical protein
MLLLLTNVKNTDLIQICTDQKSFKGLLGLFFRQSDKDKDKESVREGILEQTYVKVKAAK